MVKVDQREHRGGNTLLFSLLIPMENTCRWQDSFLYCKSYFRASECSFAYQTNKKIIHSVFKLMLQKETKEVYFCIQPKQGLKWRPNGEEGKKLSSVLLSSTVCHICICCFIIHVALMEAIENAQIFGIVFYWLWRTLNSSESENQRLARWVGGSTSLIQSKISPNCLDGLPWNFLQTLHIHGH